MSLLMDALKKAEQEKKAAANRLGNVEGNSPATTNSVDDAENAEDSVISKEITGEHKKPLTELETKTGRTSINDYTSTAELTLAPIERVERTEEPPQTTDLDETGAEDVTLNITASDLNIDPLPESEEDLEDPVATDMPHEETVAGELNIDSAASFDETFHGVSLDGDDPELFQETMQGEAYVPEEGKDSYEETLPGVSAVQFAKDIGGEDLPTPVAAQTVFAATSTTAGTSSGYKWVLISLAIMAVIAAGVWYYYTVTPMTRALPSPHVAKGIESIVPVQSAASGPEEIMSGSLSGVDEEGQAGFGEDDVTGDAVSPESLSTAQVEIEEQDSVDDEIAAVGTEKSVQAEQLPPESEADSPVAMAEQEPAVEKLSAMFKISRSKPTGEKSSLINEAYLAYQQGEVETAKQKYTEILKEFPENRDALLGLGAIALAAGDLSRAFMFYSEILRLNPQDGVVRAMLINLRSQADPLSSVSTIKNMLHDDPEQPVLYFTLGNVYARDSRWSEAQEAFFNAYRLDSSNPDYAFNLAISLDYIGQYKTALDYYNVALKLADEQPINFDPTTVIKRIQILSARN